MKHKRVPICYQWELHLGQGETGYESGYLKRMKVADKDKRQTDKPVKPFQAPKLVDKKSDSEANQGFVDEAVRLLGDTDSGPRGWKTEHV